MAAKDGATTGSDELTVAIETYRWPEKLLNAGATLLHGLDLRMTRIDVDDICEAACARTGLTDWGDERFLDLFQRLVGIIDEAGVTPLARVMVRSVLVKAVVNRLKIEDHLKQHPEIADIDVSKPLFVVGFPRTGTTAMQNLLAQHRDRRALQFWEMTTPVPVYDDPETDARKRIAATNRILRVAYTLAPEMGAAHEIRATTAEEDWTLFANTFAVLNYEFQTGLTAWGDFLFEQDLSWAYTEFKRQLQILLHQRPARQLVLKCPEHLWLLDNLLKVFPDACVVWTHRDPFDAVASYCSLISMNRRAYYGRYDRHALGRHVQERFAVGVERAMAARAQAPDPDRFFDLRFVDLIEDQAAAVAAVEDHFGLDHDPDMGDKVAAWLKSKREDTRGKHRYDADRYGLDPVALHARFRRYTDAFDIPTRD